MTVQGWKGIYIQRLIFIGPHDIVIAYDPDLTIPGVYVPTLVVPVYNFSL